MRPKRIPGFRVAGLQAARGAADAASAAVAHGLEEIGAGDGPVDAAFTAITRLLEVPVTLAEYTIGAVTGGADALGEVRVVVEADGRTFAGQAVSTDITEASAEAYLRACAHAKLAIEADQDKELIEV